MRILTSNLFALLFLCAFAGVFYVWSSLEERLERHKRGFAVPVGGSFYPKLPVDLSAKTFRTLLAVPAAQRTQIKAHNGSRHDHVNGDNRSARGGSLESDSPVRGGIFWSTWLEDLVPVGFTEEYARAWRDRARASRVVKLEPGCGRVSNQLATFSDGSKACVRYGINADQVQGETLTYYLACLLGIPNLPPLVLSQMNSYSEQWGEVRARIGALQWSEHTVVSLAQWVSNLSGVVTPAPLRPDRSGLHPELRNKTAEELVDLVQWSDLILFDYLSANFDRLVSNLFSLQWDARIMERDTNNLLKTPRGDLVFIDNEAGLVHGFRVLGMWEQYHQTVLSSVCVFREKTVQRVAELHRRRDVSKRLLELYRESEPLAGELGFLSEEHATILQDRIDRVYKHILRCKEKYVEV
ncbi:four-jointed box protein 1 [Stigmatopora nigra]